MSDFSEYNKLSDNDKLDFLSKKITEKTNLPEDFLVAALKTESNPWAIWYLVKGLGIIKSSTAIPDIILLCNKPNVILNHTSLHLICAWALGQIKVGVFELLPPLLNGTYDTRLCAIDAFGELRDPRSIEILSSVLLKEPDEKLRLWAGLAISKIGTDAIPALDIAFQQCEDEDTSLIIIDAIIKIGGEKARKLIDNLLDTSTPKQLGFILERLK